MPRRFEVTLNSEEFTSVRFKYLLMPVVIYVSQNPDILANSWLLIIK